MQKIEIIEDRLDKILSHYGLCEDELSRSPDFMCEYQDVAAYRNGNKLVIGYMVRDESPFDPLEDCDGYGELIRASDQQSAVYEHLGRDSCGEPGDMIIPSDDLKVAWMVEALRSLEFTETAVNWFRDHDTDSITEDDLKDLAEQCFDQSSLGSVSLFSFDAYSKAVNKMWGKHIQLDEDTRYTCPIVICGSTLDIEGPDAIECPDTYPDKWDAVWIPCKDMVESIDERAEVYRFGCVDDSYENGKKVWVATLNHAVGGLKSPSFPDWYQAYQWLEAYIEEHKLLENHADADGCSLRSGQVAAALAVATSCLAEYQAYLEGDVFVEQYDTFILVGDGDEAYWELEEDDSCGGYYDADYLSTEIIGSIKSLAEYDQKQSPTETEAA